MEAEFSASIPFDAVSIRHDPRAGGGALMDLGCYPVHWVRAFLDEEPAVASATATLNPLGTDMSMFASLDFPSGVTATVCCSMQDGPIIQRMTIIGTNGIVEVEGLIFPSLGHSIRETVGGVLRVRTVAGAETYDHQLEAIVRGLESGERLLTEGEDSVRNMMLIDEIYRAAGLQS